MCGNAVTVLTESLMGDSLRSHFCSRETFNYAGCASVLTAVATLHPRCDGKHERTSTPSAARAEAASEQWV